MKNNDILKEFDETWGWAPKEKPKYKKGKMVKAFISKALEERDREWKAKVEGLRMERKSVQELFGNVKAEPTPKFAEMVNKKEY